jgi:outer membrane protein TolC
MLHTLLVLALSQAPAAPGEPLTLEQVFALADQNHVDVQLAELSLQQAAQDEKGSYAGILPRLDFFSSVSRTYARSSGGLVTINGTVQQLPPSDGFVPTTWSAQLAASQNLFDGGKWWTRIAKGHTDRAAAEAQLAEARLQVHLSVAHFFYEVVRAQRSLEILAVNVERSQQQLERAQALFEAGRGPKSDVFAAQVNLVNDQISVAKQRSAVDLARNSLNLALGRPAEVAIDPRPPDLTVKPAPVAAAAADAQALGSRPGLNQLRKEIESAGQAVDLAKGDYYPALNAGLAYQRGPGDFSTVINNPGNDFSATGSINLSWNIFEGRATDVAVQKAELASSTARVNLLKSERSVTEETEKAVRTLSVNLESLELAERAQQAASLGLQLAEERFKAGAASNLEVRDAQQKLTTAELTLISNRIDVHLAALDVRAAQGQL